MEQTSRKSRKSARDAAASPPAEHRLPALVDTASSKPTATDTPAHPHQDIDRLVRATIAKYTAGVSPFSIYQAWSDWAMHLARAPGRQLELSETALKNTTAVLDHAFKASIDSAAEAPFSPKRHDHRFAHSGWAKMPFSFWQQSFLATQDWWDHATDSLRGLSKDDSDRVRFMVRQALDLVSPSNFPTTNPEIIEETFRKKGANLAEGARHLTEDLVQTWSQKAVPAPDGFRIGEDIA